MPNGWAAYDFTISEFNKLTYSSICSNRNWTCWINWLYDLTLIMYFINFWIISQLEIVNKKYTQYTNIEIFESKLTLKWHFCFVIWIMARNPFDILWMSYTQRLWSFRWLCIVWRHMITQYIWILRLGNHKEIIK